MSVLREIVARFGVSFDAKPLDQGHEKIESVAESLKKLGEVAIGGYAIKEVVEFGRGLLEEADSLAKVSQGLGLTAEELQRLEHAASLSGVGVDTLRMSLGHLQKVAADAATQGGQAGKAWTDLGVKLKNPDGSLRSTGDLFTEAAGKLGEMTDSTKRAGIASQLFGRNYVPLIPLFKEGRAGIAELKGEVDELGFGFDDAFLKNSQEINDNLDRLKGGLKGIAIQAIGPLLPDLVDLTKHGVELAKQLVGMLKHTEALKAGLVTLGGTGVVALLGKLGGGAGLTGVLRTLSGVALKTVLPFLLLDDAITFLGGGKSVIGDKLEALFGPGTSDKVRAWVKSVTDELGKFVKDNPELVTALGGIAIAIAGLGKTEGAVSGIGGIARALGSGSPFMVAVAAATAAVLALKAAWDQWDKLKKELSLGSDYQQNINAKREAGIPDSQIPELKPQDHGILDRIPFLNTIRDTFGPGAGIAKAHDEAAAAASVPVPSSPKQSTTIQQTNKISVSVPPGTPRQQARDIAAAASQAVKDTTEDLRATVAATSQASG